MKTNLWKLLTVMIILTMLVLSLAGCGATPMPTAVATQVPAAPTQAPAAAPTQAPTAAPTEAPTTLPTEAPTITPAAAEPVTMRIGTTFIWDGPNVGVATSNWGLWRLIYDSVVETGALGTYIPGLAESWSVSDDGLVWTFKIRKGVTFHDGTPCTAEDVAWSLNWMITVGNDSLSYLWWNFKEVVALDDTTLQITTGDPIGNMEYLMFWAFIVPKSVWGQFDNYDDMSEFTELAAATATGPYKVVDWSPDEYLILEADEDYWGGKPAIDRIVWQQYATEDAMVQALLAGEIDFIDVVPATAVQTLQEAENIKVEIMEGHAVDELSINSHENGTQPASLNDPVVRKAIEYAIDRQRIIDVAYLGFGTPATTMIAPSLGDWHNSDIKAISFDPDEGNRILDEAGYVDSNGDGVREWSDGTALEYRLMSDDAATSARIAEIIANGLSQVGISTILTPLDYDSQLNKAYEGDWDLNYWWWGMDIDPDFGMVIFKCDERDGGWNPNGYCNEEYEELYKQQASAVDHEARRQVIWKMQEKIYNDRPWIVLLYRATISAYRSDRFTGFNPMAKYLYGKWSVLQAKPVQ
jgi:peptide/nickel transport system substrate-binding protein